MKAHIIKLNLSGTTVHVNAVQILYYYAKKNEEGHQVTELFFTEKFGLEVLDTPSLVPPSPVNATETFCCPLNL